jgi:acyl-CoA thioester hydrolase
MAGLPLYSTPIAPEWIDFNGHLRDAYYGLVLSYATDALMDRIGVDAEYRARTRCTLYTVETYINYRHEVLASDRLEVLTRILACDHKRIHAAFELTVARRREPAATAEQLMLHVRQDATPVTASFPPEISAALAALRQASVGLAADGPSSRALGLTRR